MVPEKFKMAKHDIGAIESSDSAEPEDIEVVEAVSAEPETVVAPEVKNYSIQDLK